MTRPEQHPLNRRKRLTNTRELLQSPLPDVHRGVSSQSEQLSNVLNHVCTITRWATQQNSAWLRVRPARHSLHAALAILRVTLAIQNTFHSLCIVSMHVPAGHSEGRLAPPGGAAAAAIVHARMAACRRYPMAYVPDVVCIRGNVSESIYPGHQRPSRLKQSGRGPFSRLAMPAMAYTYVWLNSCSWDGVSPQRHELVQAGAMFITILFYRMSPLCQRQQTGISS